MSTDPWRFRGGTWFWKPGESPDERLAAVGGAGLVWMPDAPPITPNAKDDEFNAAGLDPKWLTWNPGGGLTVSVGESCAKLLQTSQPGDSVCGIYQPIPAAAEWVAYAKCSSRAGFQRFFGAGIFLAEDIASAPTTADFLSCFMVAGNNVDDGYLQATLWSSYTTVTTSIRSINPFPRWSALYMRVRVGGGNASFDVSSDGIGWQIMMDQPNPLGATAYVGLGVNNFNTGNTLDGLFDFFRVQAGAGTSAFRGTSLGRLALV